MQGINSKQGDKSSSRQITNRGNNEEETREQEEANDEPTPVFNRFHTLRLLNDLELEMAPDNIGSNEENEVD